ncbi:MAG: hypothetical protein JWN67_938 [Actinomycetia bacterium]|nr:hypothetical protein [Actinomycetes bacterium]
MRAVLTAVVGVPAVVAVGVVVHRHGQAEAFVSWPVIGVAVLAAVVAVLGVWTRQPDSALVGLAALVPAAILIYVVPAVAPLAFVVVALVVLAGLALRVGGFASALATFAALFLLLLTVVQDPAVECGDHNTTTSSGPWWISTADDTFASVTGGRDGTSRGTVKVGDDVYGYACQGGRLVEFGRDELDD